MNYHDRKQINNVLILRRSEGEDSTDTTCCVTDGDPWTAPTYLLVKSTFKKEKPRFAIKIFRTELVNM